MTTAKKPEISAAELELKRRGRRRLIGAATLGLLAIVILPMVFDSEPKSDAIHKKAVKQEIAIQIPPKEGLPPVTEPSMPAPTAGSATAPTAPTATLPVSKSSAAVEPAKPAAAAADAKPTSAESKSDTATKAAALETKTKAEPNAATKPEPVKAGFVVQVGAFKDAENAKSIVAQMKEAKLPAFTDTIAVKSGSVTRVRVGPYPTKVKADGALAQVKLAGADGKVVPLP